jgi:hypothetical protein
MKVAITGHTSGIGQALLDLYPDALGFSRSNGYDITIKDTRNKIIEESYDCDVFINNAYAEFGQQCLLYELWENWKDKNRIIVNLGSRAADFVNNARYPHYRYSIQKQALESASIYMSNSMRSCKVVCVKPGYVDTDSVRNVLEKKMDPKELALYIKELVELRYSTFWIPVVTLYPR